MFNEGDIIEIPLPIGKTAIGWLLHKSKTFKNAVGIIVFGLAGVSRRAEFEAEGALNVLGPMYMHIAALEYYRCRVVGHQPVTADKLLLTKRLVGGGVYVGDSYIGDPKKTEDQNLHEMEVRGMPVMLQRIIEAFG